MEEWDLSYTASWLVDKRYYSCVFVVWTRISSSSYQSVFNEIPFTYLTHIQNKIDKMDRSNKAYRIERLCPAVERNKWIKSFTNLMFALFHCNDHFWVNIFYGTWTMVFQSNFKRLGRQVMITSVWTVERSLPRTVLVNILQLNPQRVVLPL